MPKHLYIENRHLCRIFLGSLPDLFCPFRVPKAVASLSHCEYLTDNIRTLQHIFRPLRPAIIQSLLQIVHVEKSEATWCDGGGIVTLENVPNL